MERTENLNFNQTDRVAAIGKALSSEIRIQILEALEEQEHNVNELAELLELPASSTAMHVRVLEEAGLIETELRAAVRGSMKMCRKSVDSLMIQLRKEKDEKVEKISMPIGNYVDYHVEPTCGIVSGDGHIDMEDEPAVFYNPRRVEAKLLWFGIWNIAFPMLHSRKIHSVNWKFQRKYARRIMNIIWTIRPISPYGSMRSKQALTNVQAILEEERED